LAMAEGSTATFGGAAGRFPCWVSQDGTQSREMVRIEIHPAARRSKFANPRRRFERGSMSWSNARYTGCVPLLLNADSHDVSGGPVSRAW
jgi:hypothetical protein